MKTKFIPFICLFPIFFIISCEKIQPEIQKKSTTPIVNNSQGQIIDNMKMLKTKNCGIISCNYKQELSKKYTGPFPDSDKYQELLYILLMKYPENDRLVQSNEFKTFSHSINQALFGCEKNIYNCIDKEKKYSGEKKDYFFYNLLPGFIAGEYEKVRGVSDGTEDIIQAIKRNDFEDSVTKEIKISIYKKKVVKLAEELLDSDYYGEKIDIKRLLTDTVYFQKIILEPKYGIQDNIIKEIYAINIDWENTKQLDEIYNFTLEVFYNSLQKIGISKANYRQSIMSIYGFSSLDNITEKIASKLSEKVDILEKKYIISNDIPDNRYYRNDELYIFNTDALFSTTTKLSGGDNEAFEKSVLEIRNLTLLLYVFGGKEKLYFLPNRLDKYEFENKYLLTNIYKYSKYLNFNKKIKY